MLPIDSIQYITCCLTLFYFISTHVWSSIYVAHRPIYEPGRSITCLGGRPPVTTGILTRRNQKKPEGWKLRSVRPSFPACEVRTSPWAPQEQFMTKIIKEKSRKAEICHIRFFIYQNPYLTKYCVEVGWTVKKYQVGSRRGVVS